jgi:Protein of unknown function (DUF1592)/Protein of unknown function (DUF1588)/Protein of unknown function (DUF1585)/Protein of unknown function (DUF1587)/Protein of unknown function (DUF1595)/Planctomycete cytochrome C
MKASPVGAPLAGARASRAPRASSSDAPTCVMFALLALAPSLHAASAPAFDRAAAETLTGKFCSSCHNEVDKEGGFDLDSLAFKPDDPTNFQRWVKVHDRLRAGEMPPKDEKRPDATELSKFVQSLSSSLVAQERAVTAREGRATQRRLNRVEYENALRDLFQAPWLQVQGLFPEDGESYRFNKVASALDVSHVHLARYMSAADYAMRQAVSVQFVRPPTTVTRHYARDQRTLTSKFTQNPLNPLPDRQTYPVLGTKAQPEVRTLEAPLTVGDANPEIREQEAVGWVSSNYVTGFTYRWDGYRAPVAGRYRVRFSGYTLWAGPGGFQRRFANGSDRVGVPRPPEKHLPNYDLISPGRTTENISVYTRNGVMNRRVGEFDITPEPAVQDIGEVWLLANETLAPDATRFFRSRPPGNFHNPLMTPDGGPSVAFRWMEIEGPLYDEATGAGYRLLFGDLPLRKSESGKGLLVPVLARTREGGARGGGGGGNRAEPLEEVAVEVVSADPKKDADRLMRAFIARAYRRPVAEAEVQRFLGLVDEREKAGLSFTEAMIAGYTAVLASPGFVFLDEKPGKLDDYALATRLALFLTNSTPDEALRARAARGELSKPGVLREETERLLSGPNARRFVESFLDYWIDLRKIDDTTPSTTLYSDYYLDEALTEAAVAETRLFFSELLQRNLPVRNIVDSDFTFLNERLAAHYGMPEIKGVAMRRVSLPADSVRGGLLTQASVLKITANGTTTSPVLRGNWIVQRIMGLEIPPPPPVAAVDPDIRGAVTIRQQLEKHRADASCATCHSKMDPPGFALESFDVMGAFRTRYRASAEGVPVEPGRGKNGHPFEFHYALPVDASGALPDGRPFADVREFKRLLRADDTPIARNLARQLTIFATGAPVRFSDRAAIEKILEATSSSGYGVRSLVHEIVQSDLFREK